MPCHTIAWELFCLVEEEAELHRYTVKPIKMYYYSFHLTNILLRGACPHFVIQPLLLQQLFVCSRFDDMTRVHYYYAVRYPCRAETMGDEHAGFILCDRREHFIYARFFKWIYRRCRFIEQEYFAAAITSE